MDTSQVIGCARRQDRIDALNKEFPDHKFYVVDTSDYAAVSKFAEDVMNSKVSVDILINNAGISPRRGLPWDQDVEEFGKVMDVNIKGVFMMCKAFIPGMIAHHLGTGRLKRVINTSSGLGHSTSPILMAYNTSKWAVESMSKSIAQVRLFSGDPF
jgi:NADP-dependent 3-hydroxy acid dehydrogenase YdfG